MDTVELNQRNLCPIFYKNDENEEKITVPYGLAFGKTCLATSHGIVKSGPLCNENVSSSKSLSLHERSVSMIKKLCSGAARGGVIGLGLGLGLGISVASISIAVALNVATAGVSATAGGGAIVASTIAGASIGGAGAGAGAIKATNIASRKAVLIAGTGICAAGFAACFAGFGNVAGVGVASMDVATLNHAVTYTKNTGILPS